MKSEGYNKKSLRKRFLFSNLFANIYYFFATYLYLMLAVLGAAVGIAFLLLIANLLFPRYVNIYNLALTEKTFTELYENHKYHEAVALMEIKQELIDQSKEPWKFRQEIADCYVATGDYPKALQQYQLLRKTLEGELKENKPKNISESDLNTLWQIIDISLLKEEFRIYLKMGDIPGLKDFYNRIFHLHQNIDWKKLDKFFNEKQNQKINEVLEGRKYQDGFTLELCQGKFLLDPQEGLADMKRYTDDVLKSRKYNHIYKLRLISNLTHMLIEQNRIIDARIYMERALRIADFFKYNDIAPIVDDFEKLIEDCFKLNDADSGKHLLKLYTTYIEKNYKEREIEYAKSSGLKLKYLGEELSVKERTKLLSESSESIRKHIDKNFIGMTSSQREFLVKQFLPLLQVGNSMLEQNQSSDLAKVVFDNNMFLRGLLMRSTSAISNTINAMGKPALKNRYKRYQEVRNEIISREYVSGLGNSYELSKLKKEEEQLEKSIANECLDFRRLNKSNILTSSEVSKMLNSNEVAIQIIEGGNEYFALLLDNKGNIKYIPFGNKNEILRLTANIAELYGNPTKTSFVKQLANMIKGKKAYLSGQGLYSSIALGAIPIDQQSLTLADVSELYYLGSISDLPEIKGREAFDLKAHNTVLWGGINYGPEKFVADNASRAIERGDMLAYLPGSAAEVNDISKLLRAQKMKYEIFSGDNAKENTFVDRSHKKDYILHVSTHGFFQDNGAFADPMQNSGLLFANSQQYWENPSLVGTIEEKDGILRADEISSLDLNGCRLVVLSACQTGLGKEVAEGVFGLQRAFKLAGVQNVLMSLWKVNDDATQKLMTNFYESLLNGKEPNEALRLAQLELRHKGYPVSQWAPFILLN